MPPLTPHSRGYINYVNSRGRCFGLLRIAAQLLRAHRHLEQQSCCANRSVPAFALMYLIKIDTLLSLSPLLARVRVIVTELRRASSSYQTCVASRRRLRRRVWRFLWCAAVWDATFSLVFYYYKKSGDLRTFPLYRGHLCLKCCLLIALSLLPCSIRTYATVNSMCVCTAVVFVRRVLLRPRSRYCTCIHVFIARRRVMWLCCV